MRNTLVEAQECLEADSLLVLNAFCFSDFLWLLGFLSDLWQ